MPLINPTTVLVCRSAPRENWPSPVVPVGVKPRLLRPLPPIPQLTWTGGPLGHVTWPAPPQYTSAAPPGSGTAPEKVAVVVVATCAAAPTGMANRASAPAMTAAVRFFRILFRPHVAPWLRPGAGAPDAARAPGAPRPEHAAWEGCGGCGACDSLSGPFQRRRPGKTPTNLPELRDH